MHRYGERLELLQRLAHRLETAGVPCVLKRHVPASAVCDPNEETVPALFVAGEQECVRVLYWRFPGADESRPFFIWFDSVRRYPADEEGIDLLAALVTLIWRTAETDREM